MDEEPKDPIKKSIRVLAKTLCDTSPDLVETKLHDFYVDEFKDLLSASKAWMKRAEAQEIEILNLKHEIDKLCGKKKPEAQILAPDGIASTTKVGPAQ